MQDNEKKKILNKNIYNKNRTRKKPLSKKRIGKRLNEAKKRKKLQATEKLEEQYSEIRGKLVSAIKKKEIDFEEKKINNVNEDPKALSALAQLLVFLTLDKRNSYLIFSNIFPRTLKSPDLKFYPADNVKKMLGILSEKFPLWLKIDESKKNPRYCLDRNFFNGVLNSIENKNATYFSALTKTLVKRIKNQYISRAQGDLDYSDVIIPETILETDSNEVRDYKGALILAGLKAHDKYFNKYMT